MLKGVNRFVVAGKEIFELSERTGEVCGPGCTMCDDNDKGRINRRKINYDKMMCSVCHKAGLFFTWQYFTPTTKVRKIMKAMRLQVNYGA